MQMTECVCQKCGKKFSLPTKDVRKGRGKFCSRECSGNARGRVEVTCDYCGKAFTKTRYFAQKSKKHYCSTECLGLSARTRIERTCEVCGARFTEVPSRVAKGLGKYCGAECFGKAKRRPIEVKCGTCGKTFVLREGRVRKTNYCSRGCNATGISLRQRGEKSHTWKGGRVSYRGPNWNQQRSLAYARDNKMCQVCLRQHRKGTRSFEVHHIRPFRQFNGDYLAANDLSNLITLCPTCHRKAEHGKVSVPKRLL